MKIRDPRTYLWENICALMGEDEPSVNAVQKRTKVGRGTIQRIRDGDASTRIGSITKIAEELGVEVWELLSPDAKNPPAVAPRDNGWPLEEVDVDRYARLTATQKGRAQQGMISAIEKIEAEQAARSALSGKGATTEPGGTTVLAQR